jgi:hypothetical protein
LHGQVEIELAAPAGRPADDLCPPPRALAALPITQGDVAIGAVGWVFDQPQASLEPVRGALSDIATDCYSMLARSPGAVSRAQPLA